MKLVPDFDHLSHVSSWPETRWDRVLALRDPAEREAALREVCELYRGVILAICRRWNEQEAEDLAHGFLLWVIESGRLGLADPARGRFRNYLGAMLENFLRKSYRADQALKRGGGAEHLPWVDDLAGAEVGTDAHFDRVWAQELMGRVVTALRTEVGDSLMMRTVLPTLLATEEPESWQEMSTRLEVPAGTLRAQASRLRQRFRELLEKEVSVCTSGRDVEAEIRHLMRALVAGSSK